MPKSTARQQAARKRAVANPWDKECHDAPIGKHSEPGAGSRPGNVHRMSGDKKTPRTHQYGSRPKGLSVSYH